MSIESWKIFIEETFEDFGLPIPQKIDELAEAMFDNADAISSMGFDMMGGPSRESVDYKSLYMSTLKELGKYKEEATIFRNSVARRHNTDPSSVRLEGDTVMIYK